MKPRIFVLVADRDGRFNYSALSTLGQTRKSKICNTIFLISENVEDDSYDKIAEEVNKELISFKLAEEFVLFILTKDDLSEIFHSEDRVKCFDAIIERQIFPIE